MGPFHFVKRNGPNEKRNNLIGKRKKMEKQMKQINGTILQYFEWYLDVPEGLWNKIRNEAEDLSKLGITSLWLPPAYKGINGKN